MLKLFTAALVIGAFVLVAGAQPIRAVEVVSCEGLSDQECKVVSDKKLAPNKSNIVWKVMQGVFMVLGGIAVIMVVVGGLRYAISGGDPGAVKSAKNTILYAVIGLIVAVSASAIVLFVNNYFT